MKLRIVLAAVLFILISGMQSYSQCISGFGVKAGATFSNINRDFLDNFSFKTKYHIGYNGSLFADLLNKKNLNIEAEIGYDQRGYKDVIIRTDEFGNEIGEDIISYDTHYFTAAVLGKFKLPGNNLTPYVILGPRLDIFLGYSSHYPSDLSEFEDAGNYFLENYKKINYSVTLGAGIQFEKLLPFKTFIELGAQPPVNTSLDNAFVKIKEYSFNAKLGINFIKDKVKPKKK